MEKVMFDSILWRISVGMSVFGGIRVNEEHWQRCSPPKHLHNFSSLCDSCCCKKKGGEWVGVCVCFRMHPQWNAPKSYSLFFCLFSPNSFCLQRGILSEHMPSWILSELRIRSLYSADLCRIIGWQKARGLRLQSPVLEDLIWFCVR